MKNQRLQLIWLLVEVFCIIRSALATFNVTMSVSNSDTAFSLFTVGVVELSLFAMLLMSGSEAVAPLAAIVLIAFSAVLQYAELGLLTGSLDAQSKEMIRYAVSFAPTVLLLVGLVKRLTDGAEFNFDGVLDSLRSWFGGEKSNASRSTGFDVEMPKRKSNRPFVRRRGSKTSR